MAEDMDSVVSNIRALIVSSKFPVALRSLSRDYETMIGNPIPYRSFNFHTLDSFLQSIKTIRVTGSGRDLFVEAVKDESSSHISQMISKQKTTKKPPPHVRRGGSTHGFSQRGGYSQRGSFAPRPSASSRYSTSSSYQSYPKKEFSSNSNSDYQPYSKKDYGAKSNNVDHQPYPRKEYTENSNSLEHQPYYKKDYGAKSNNADHQPYPRKEYATNSNNADHQPYPRNEYAGNSNNADRQSYYKKEYTANSNSNVDHQPEKPPPAKREYTANSNVVERKTTTNLVVVASDDTRQVSLEQKRPQKESKSSYVMPPRFQRNRQRITSASDNIEDSLDYITKDVEDTLFLEEPVKSDLRLRELDTNIISALKPSQLVAVGRAKQEIAQTQSDGLYLQGAANNSSGQVQEPEVPKPDSTNILNNVNLLLNYSSAKNWKVPEYNLVFRKPKSGPPFYGATVKLDLNGHIRKFTSYPNEDKNANVAKGYAAKRALEELFAEKEKVKLQKPIICSDKNTIIDRVSKIVAGHYNGMFSNTVENIYNEKYMEQLPSEWLLMLNSCPTLSVETTLKNSIIIPSLDLVNDLNFVPQVLVPPKENIWDVYVTSATTTCQVWLRLIGENYSEKYEELLTNMEQFYKLRGISQLPLTFEEGVHYAAESSDGWLRVCITAVNDKTKTVNALLIDHGDNDIFAFKNLYRLPKEFCELPRQALQCSLEGLESFSDDPCCGELLSSCEYLIGNSLVAEINSRDETNGLIKITLFDTSGTDDINVNEKLLEKFTSESRYPVPKLPEKGQLEEVYVSHISNRGEVYIQIASVSFNQMAELIQSLSPTEISKHKLTSYRQVKLNKIYLAKYSKDDCWYRAVITSTPSVQQNKIALRFVDYGNSETVSITDITDVENLPPIISKLPPQAIKVALNNLPYEKLTQSQIAWLQSNVQGEDKVVIIKVVNDLQDVPEVDLFCRDNCGNGNAVYVNLTVATEDINIDRSDNNTISEKASISYHVANENAMSYLNLKKPNFDDDSFQEVELILTANPGNFVFQLKKYSEELDDLMTRLHDLYSTVDFPELKANEIVIGGLYAGFQEQWLRVVVTESTINSKVPVRFIDFGDVMMVPVSALRKLDSSFCENPFMAIKGRLAGVAPIHTDWSVEDCIRFQQLVLKKPLASTVIKVDDKYENPLDMVVNLRLIDTLSDKDIVIADVLCNEYRAVCVNDS